jgi:hypothetical protein
MTRKRNITTSFLLMLRHLGMLCKPKREEPRRLRIARTTYPDSRVSPIESEQHVWIQNKLKARPHCQFDSITRTCACGVKTIEQFAAGCNTIK